MVQRFANWLAEHPEQSWDTPGINDFFLAQDFAASYRNRMGTELIRFGKMILGKPAAHLDFLRALESMEKKPAMPSEAREKLSARIAEQLRDAENANLHDVCLAFMDRFGARPNEALKLATGHGDFQHVSSRLDVAAKPPISTAKTRSQTANSPRRNDSSPVLPQQSSSLVPLVSPEEAKAALGTASSYWQAALDQDNTKTRMPYVWLIPDEATPAETELQLLGRAIERHRRAMNK